MRILIHCHGGPAIGVGHVFRSAALAEVALDRGHQVDISGRLEGELVTERLGALDLELVADPDPRSYDVVHLDTYLPDGDDVAARAAGVAVVSNVEDGEYGRRPAGLVIDPNVGAEATLRPADSVLLRGARWTLLRRSVREAAGTAELRPEPRRVLVVIGGTDPLGVTGEVLAALAATGRDLAVTAISQADRRDELARSATALGMDVELVLPGPDLTGLMLDQDLVVSAAGTAATELCCLGLPAALVCVADNQEAGYQRLLERGAAIGLGSAMAGLDHDAAVATLTSALDDRTVRNRIAAAGRRLFDGHGAWRVVRSWEQLAQRHTGRSRAAPLDVRLATEADAATLLRWRNDPGTRAWARQSGEVAADEHQAWLAATLADPGRALLIASDGAGDVGTVRWDRLDDGEWEVSITVAPHRRGRGRALPLLSAGESWLATQVPATHTMLADVHLDNAASLRLFQAAGYLPERPPSQDRFIGLVKQRVPTGGRG